MSTSNYSENSSSNPGPGGGGQVGGPNSHPHQRLADATQIVYSWLPHSKALGASSTVAIRVRNASLTDVVGGQPGSNSAYLSSLAAAASVIHDEKKDSEEEDERIDESTRSTRNKNLLLMHAPQCRVEASIYGYGLPLQATPISTKYSPLLPYNHRSSANKIINSDILQHLDFQCGKDWSTVNFDTLMRLPYAPEAFWCQSTS